jgi:hypothetical protein
MKTKFQLHRIAMTNDDGEPEIWFAVTDGNEHGFLIGDADDLQAFKDAINGEVFGDDLHRFNEALGWRWITVSEAAKEYGVPVSTVRRWAPLIDGAKKRGRAWVFPAISFRSYMSQNKQEEYEVYELTALDRLIETHGGNFQIKYVGDVWGSDEELTTLSDLRHDLENIGYNTDGMTAYTHRGESGDVILADAAGNPVLEVA